MPNKFENHFNFLRASGVPYLYFEKVLKETGGYIPPKKIEMGF
jgi:hypothetical protein